MSDATVESRASAPAHLMIVGVLATLWNGFACVDYVMSRTHNAGWMRTMMPNSDPATIWAYMDSVPVWASFGWGLAVWTGLAGSLALLARSRHAVPLFIASLVGMVLAFGHQLLIADNVPAEIASPVMPLVVMAIGIALLAYARRQRDRGALA